LRRRTALISRTSLLFCNLVGSRDHLEIKVIRVITVLQVLRVHPPAHQADQDLTGHQGLVAVEAQ